MEKHQIIVFTFISIFNFKYLNNPVILGNLKSNGLTSISKYPTKYLELVFVSTNFEITIASTSQIFVELFISYFRLLLLSRQISTLFYYQQNFALLFS